MHTPNQTASSNPIRGRTRTASIALPSLALAGLLQACGGGGGGGGGGSASETAGVPNAGAAPTSTWPFPFGMSVASPTALAPASDVIPGALGIENLGLSTAMATQQAVSSRRIGVLTA
jgi:hypothetical protein